MNPPPLSMVITVPRTCRYYALVTVRGDVDRAGIGRLHTQLTRLVQAGAREIRLDLSGVRHHDPAVRDLLGQTRGWLRAHGGQLRTIGAASQLTDELNHSGTRHGGGTRAG